MQQQAAVVHHIFRSPSFPSNPCCNRSSQMLADDWTSLRDVQYRKIHLYDLDWAQDEDRQLDRCLVAVAKYGGAVAMVRDETKLLKVRGALREQRRLLPAVSCPLL